MLLKRFMSDSFVIAFTTGGARGNGVAFGLVAHFVNTHITPSGGGGPADSVSDSVAEDRSSDRRKNRQTTFGDVRFCQCNDRAKLEKQTTTRRECWLCDEKRHRR